MCVAMAGEEEGDKLKSPTDTHTTMAEMLEKTLVRPLGCTETQPAHPKGN